MSTIYTTCPSCSQPVEMDEALANDAVQCPSCSGQFIPRVARQETSPLARLRERSHYPELRQFVSVIFWIGLVILCLWALGAIVDGISTARDTSKSADGTDTALAGIGIGILAALWWKLFRPLASLLIDIADALVEMTRQ